VGHWIAHQLSALHPSTVDEDVELLQSAAMTSAEDTARVTPEELRAPSGTRMVEILWADGATTPIHHRTLRGFCPCAHCQGHQGPIEWVEGTGELPDAALELTGIAEVGQYALQLRFPATV
jgi:DUF971 family protein